LLNMPCRVTGFFTGNQIPILVTDLPQSGSVVLGNELSSCEHFENELVKVTYTGGLKGL
jgi:hypothetical protein